MCRTFGPPLKFDTARLRWETEGVKKLIRDPQLDELVRELNEGDAPSAEPVPEGQIGSVPTDNPLEQLLIDAVQRQASDVHVIAGAPPMFRIAGQLTAAAETAL